MQMAIVYIDEAYYENIAKSAIILCFKIVQVLNSLLHKITHIRDYIEFQQVELELK